MSIWGKVIGGVAGFAMGGPLGALIGGVAGHMYDQRKEEEALLGPDMGDGEAANEARQVAFTQAVIVLAAKMAKSDGAVSKDEILAFRRMFHVPPEDEAAVGKLFNDLGKRYATRQGGYLRILKCGFRTGDNAPMAYVELVDRPVAGAAVDAE